MCGGVNLTVNSAIFRGGKCEGSAAGARAGASEVRCQCFVRKTVGGSVCDANFYVKQVEVVV